MTDLVVTVPQRLWAEWLAEGDCAGAPDTGSEYSWWTGRAGLGKKLYKPPIEVGERLYIVAYGLLRGYAPVTAVDLVDGKWVICRRGGAVACTIPAVIDGFQGWRKRWWETSIERPFPEWKTAIGPKSTAPRGSWGRKDG